jgi:endonuclease G
MKPNHIITLLFFCATIISLHADEFFFGGMPKTNGVINDFDITVVTNRPYVVGYDENRKDPLWAAYKLVKRNPLFKLPRPSVSYAMDDQTKSKVPTNGYKENPPEELIGNTVWAHGHMAANDALGEIYGKDAQLASFKMSNMCPQSGRLNGGKWRTLEQKVVKYAQKFGEIYVICGPIFEKQIVPRLKYGVAVPNKYYKILLHLNAGKPEAMAIVFDYYPRVGNANEYLQQHLVSIRTVEKLTGLDFFNQFPKSTQDAFEKVALTQIWETQ